MNVFGGLPRARCAKKLLTSDKNNIIYCRTRNGDSEYEKQWPDQPPFQSVGGKFEIEKIRVNAATAAGRSHALFRRHETDKQQAIAAFHSFKETVSDSVGREDVLDRKIRTMTH